MRANQAVRAAAAISGKSLASLSVSAGRNERFAANVCSGDKEPSAATIAMLLEPCGYSLAAIPSKDIPSSALVIDQKRK